MSKATVQAALGPVALRHVQHVRGKSGDAVSGTEDEERYANIVLIICILSIVITAPLGAILISLTGTKLLTKTKQPVNTEGEYLSDYVSLFILFQQLANSASDWTLTSKHLLGNVCLLRLHNT